MTDRTRSLLAFVLVALTFASVVVIASDRLRGQRLDLTEDKLFTLSDGTREAIAALKEPITFRYFFSDSLAPGYAGLGTYAARVRDMLEEYAALSNGRIQLETIDPRPYTEDEDRAVGSGLTGAPTPNGDVLYFGLVAENLADGREIIPFFTQERETLLEYDLTRIVVALGDPAKPRVALLTGLPMEYGPGGVMAAMQGQGRPYAIYEELKNNFDLVKLDEGMTEVPGDVAALILAQPPTLSPAALYAIDQYVMRGGHVIAFLDPLAETANLATLRGGAQQMPAQTEADFANLEPLLKSWGVTIDPNEVVADSTRATRVNTGGQARRLNVDYVAWIGLQAADFDPADPIVADLGLVNFASTGFVTARDDAALELTPLGQSSDASMLISPVKVRLTPDPEALLREFKATGERYTLVARLDGETVSAFADGPPEGAASGDDQTHLAKSAAATTIVVVPDVDVLEDQFWLQAQQIGDQRVMTPRADNHALLFNAVDAFVGGRALSSLRTRGVSQRPFTVVEDLRRAAEQRFLVEEQSLQQKVKDVEARIRELRAAGLAADDGAARAAEAAELQRFTGDLLEARAELRQVQSGLREDVDALQRRVIWANIGLVPVAVGVIALIVAATRRRRRSAAAAARRT